jgi:hypothetical protein
VEHRWNEQSCRSSIVFLAERTHTNGPSLTSHHLPAATWSWERFKSDSLVKRFNCPVGEASTAEAVTAPAYSYTQLFDTQGVTVL